MRNNRGRSKAGMEVQACDPRTWQVEANRLGVHAQSLLYIVFEANPGYTTLCLKIK